MLKHIGYFKNMIIRMKTYSSLQDGKTWSKDYEK